MKSKVSTILFLVTIILSIVTVVEIGNTNVLISGANTSINNTDVSENFTEKSENPQDISENPNENSGNITSLQTDKASYPTSGETITVASTFYSLSGVTNSHIDYSLIDDSTGQVYTTHYTSVTGISGNSTYTDSWSISNTGFPTSGQYTLKVEWRQGTGEYGSGEIIDSKTTTFYSVPSAWFIVGIVAFLIAVAYVTRMRRWWLSFYLTGSLSVLLLIVAFFSLTGLDNYLMGIEAQNMAVVGTAFGLPTSYLSPNAFIFPDPSGWVVFGIGFECSSLIELSVLVGLLFFYPGYSIARKATYILFGIVFIYIANIIRMLTVSYVVHIFGDQYVYIAHTFIGKLLFFTCVVILFWYLLTKPTLKIVETNIKRGKF